MTQLNRPVRRTLDGIDRKGIVVTLYPTGVIGLRAKRTRKEHTLPLARVYRWAVEATLEERKRQKEAERIARGGKPRRQLVRRGLL